MEENVSLKGTKKRERGGTRISHSNASGSRSTPQIRFELPQNPLGGRRLLIGIEQKRDGAHIGELPPGDVLPQPSLDERNEGIGDPA